MLFIPLFPFSFILKVFSVFIEILIVRKSLLTSTSNSDLPLGYVEGAWLVHLGEKAPGMPLCGFSILILTQLESVWCLLFLISKYINWSFAFWSDVIWPLKRNTISCMVHRSIGRIWWCIVVCPGRLWILLHLEIFKTCLDAYLCSLL